MSNFTVPKKYAKKVVLIATFPKHADAKELKRIISIGAFKNSGKFNNARVIQTSKGVYSVFGYDPV